MFTGLMGLSSVLNTEHSFLNVMSRAEVLDKVRFGDVIRIYGRKNCYTPHYFYLEN